MASTLHALLESQMSTTRKYFEPVLCRWRPWQPSIEVKEAEDFMAHYWSQSDNNRQDGKPRKIRSKIFCYTICWCQMLKGIPSAWITKHFFYISDVKNNAMVTSTALLKQIPETKISVHGRHGVSFEWQNCCLQRLQIRRAGVRVLS